MALAGLFVHQREARLADAANARAAEARTLTGRLAAALPRELAREAVVEGLDPTVRFELRAGDVHVPEAIGWLESPPVIDPLAGLDVLAAEALRRAFAAPLAERAAALRGFANRSDVPAAARTHAALAAAWAALRCGGEATAMVEVPELPADAPPAQRASAALLALRNGPSSAAADRIGAEPAWLARLPEARARAWLSAAAAAGADVAGWAAWVERALEHRRRLWIADAADAARLVPGLHAVDGHVLIRAGDGGALLTAAEAAALATDVLAESLLGATVSAGAVPEAIHADLLDGLLHVAAPSSLDPAALDRGAGTLAVALALLAALVAGAVLAWRSVRREVAAARVQTEFLTMVTHELKTPLAGIRLATELLHDGYVDEPDERHAWLRRLDGEAARLGMLVENVLDLGREERGERPLESRPFDLRALVVDTLAWFEPLCERDGIAIERAFGAEPVEVVGDRAALAQVLLNLLDNARKYGADGGRVVVGLGAKASRVTVTVRDFGPGVPAGEREAVFARFCRGAAQADGHVPGVGLGLHLARGLARRHGGALSCVEPRDGRAGAAFVLTLPRVEGAR